MEQQDQMDKAAAARRHAAHQDELEDEKTRSLSQGYASSSQAGLSSHIGGQIRTLPSAPAPGQPGSRFNPRVVEREEHLVRASADKNQPVPPAAPSRKRSLDIGVSPSMIHGAASGLHQVATEDREQSVAGASASGFVRGAVAGAQTPVTNAPVETLVETTAAGSTPVRDANGQSLQDLLAPTPGEDALPGTLQPLALDVIDAVQGNPPLGAVMRPAHIAALKALESHQDDGLESDGGRYGR